MALRSADVRYYLDEDVLGLAKVLGALRPDITYPGDPGATIHRRERPPCVITPRGAKDVEWIPRVAAEGWLIVTRDSAIQRHTSHLVAVREHGARMVALSGREALGTWAQLELFMLDWRRMEALAGQPGPFIYSATRSGPLRPVSLET